MARAVAVIERPRLARRIYEAMQADITVICAPSGYGKTTVLNEVFEDIAGKRIRLDLNALDDNFFRFGLALSRALMPLAPGLGSSYTAAYERALASSLPERSLAQWMSEQLKGKRATLVLDQLHYVRETDRVAEFLTALVEASRKHLRWLFSTREDLGLPVEIWRRERLMKKPIDAFDLRYEFHEVAVSAALRGVDRSHRELKEIFAGTAGWPMGVMFALRGGELFCGPESHPLLSQRVFVERTDREREFLISTCLLPYLDDSLWRAAGWHDAEQIVQDMREDLPFMFINAGSRRQYHHAFAEFLQGVVRERGPVDASAVLKIAAGALEESGDITGALLLYTRFPVADETARLSAKLPKG